MRRVASVMIGLLYLALAGPLAAADEPLEIATDGPEAAGREAEVERGPLLQSGEASFDIDVEYRLRNIYINPLELNGLDAVEVAYGVQRLRTGWHFAWSDKVEIHLQLDFLDGVLIGDNGPIWGESPYPNMGTATDARWPNDTGITTVLEEDGDPFESDDYTYGLQPINPVTVRRVWGEVSLLVGELRAGRMPSMEGRSVLGNDGDNDLNRFGPAGRGTTADRIMFGTKPIEIARALINGDPDGADSRQDRGLFFGCAYDRLVDDAVQLSGDDADQFAGSLYYLIPELDLFGLRVHDFKFSFTYAYRTAADAELKLHAMPMELRVGIEDFHLEVQAAMLIGETREVSEALSLISGKDPVLQDINAWGLFAIADYDIGPVTLTAELDYASGDPNPRPDSEISEFTYAEDTRVGLLLFPHVLRYESARSAMAATALLDSLGATSLPSSSIDTRGAFRNGMVLFPQVTWNITDDVFLRVGALFAWAAEPVVDPYETLHQDDPPRIEDDLVNYNGGPPGDYYGTELDLRLHATLWDHFLFDIEGAALLPGDALENENGEAVPSFLAEARLTFRY